MLLTDELIKCDFCGKVQVIAYDRPKPRIQEIPDGWFHKGGLLTGKHYCPECYRYYKDYQKYTQRDH